MKNPVLGSMSGRESAKPPMAWGRGSHADSWPLGSTRRQSVRRLVVRVMSVRESWGANPTKNHSRSLMIGPPSSNPRSATYALLATASIDVALIGVVCAGAVRNPGWTVPKIEPLNSFDPVLVTTLTTPPVARPYSAL